MKFDFEFAFKISVLISETWIGFSKVDMVQDTNGSWELILLRKNWEWLLFHLHDSDSLRYIP